MDFLFYNPPVGKISNVTLDATIRESHLYKNDMTDFPIEDGSEVSDHVRVLPDMLTITGVISDSPLMQGIDDFSSYSEAFSSSRVVQTIKKTGTRTEEALSELLRLSGRVYPIATISSPVRLKSVNTCSIVTGLRVYSDMIMLSLSIDRDAKSGRALTFTSEFKHLTKVAFTLTTISKPTSTVKNLDKTTPKKVTSGKTQTTVSTKKQSILFGAFKRLATGK